jgi:hypothetical protein
MKLTPLAKAFIAAVVVLVIGVATWHYKGDAIKEWAGGEKASGGDSKGDFDNLKGGPGDPARNAGSTGVSAVAIGTGKLSRPLVVGINTWAGHSPGIVFNGGMEPNPASSKKKYGIDVKFVLLEDPVAKLVALVAGRSTSCEHCRQLGLKLRSLPSRTRGKSSLRTGPAAATASLHFPRLNRSRI